METWFTNGYPDPERYREQLRVRTRRLRKLYDLQQRSQCHPNPHKRRYYAIYSSEVANAERELEAMAG